MPEASLTDRAVLAVTGPEARAFLDRVVTCAVEPVAPGRAAFGALLTPQGKILGDFVMFADGDDLLLDASGAAAADLAKRLGMYRLRAKIGIVPQPDLAVLAGWDGAPMPVDARAATSDPRLPALGWRAVVPAAPAAGDEAAYHAHRIALGVPELGRDAPFGDAFPHEAMMDGLGGVDFRKGCYIGQEVVSRMQHRGTARTRTVPVVYPEGAAPPAGTEVTAGERAIGRTGSAAGAQGLATFRLDRVADAIAAGESLSAGGVPVAIGPRPDWVRFPWPGEAMPA